MSYKCLTQYGQEITLEMRCEEACPWTRPSKISLASVLDWTKFGKMILTPLIDIDNLNLSKIEPLWSLMTKRRSNAQR